MLKKVIFYHIACLAYIFFVNSCEGAQEQNRQTNCEKYIVYTGDQYYATTMINGQRADAYCGEGTQNSPYYKEIVCPIGEVLYKKKIYLYFESGVCLTKQSKQSKQSQPTECQDYYIQRCGILGKCNSANTLLRGTNQAICNSMENCMISNNRCVDDPEFLKLNPAVR